MLWVVVALLLHPLLLPREANWQMDLRYPLEIPIFVVVVVVVVAAAEVVEVVVVGMVVAVDIGMMAVVVVDVVVAAAAAVADMPSLSFVLVKRQQHWW